MRSAVARHFRAITAAGTRGASLGDRRRILLANQSALLGALMSVGYAAAYALGGRSLWLGVAINLAAVVLYVAGIALDARGYHRVGRPFLLAVANLQIVLVSWYMGSAVGFHYYFLAFVPFSALLLTDFRARVRVAFVLLSIVLFAYFQYDAAAGAAPVHLRPHVAALVNAASTTLIFVTLSLGLLLVHAETVRAEGALQEAHARSERLLLNILPVEISERLKAGEALIADGSEEVTVLFADIVGFTPLSARLAPQQLVGVLNEIFSRFDDLCAEHGLEKIKTIGDAYMAAGGLPSPRADHADAVAALAFGMRVAIAEVSAATGHSLEIRIGLHSGPAVAGVIGKRKFAYDLWGDTVNTASRMESHGTPGEVHVTEQVRRRLGTGYSCRPRGTIEVKGKGPMETFFLDAAPAAAAAPSSPVKTLG